MRPLLFFYHEQTHYQVLLTFCLNSCGIYYLLSWSFWSLDSCNTSQVTCLSLFVVPSLHRGRSHHDAPLSPTPLNTLPPKRSQAPLSQQPGWVLLNPFLTPLTFLDQGWFSLGHVLLLFPSLLAITLGRWIWLWIWLYALIVGFSTEGQKTRNGRKQGTCNLVASLRLAFLVCLSKGIWNLWTSGAPTSLSLG